MAELDKIIGIQGGRGSFNEQAGLTHLASTGIGSYTLRYLHTIGNVLKALENGEIDFGQFAVYNTLGGEVEESYTAMNRDDISAVASYKIKIAHALMIESAAKLSDIDTIMTHPQVLRQCKQNLEKQFAHLKLVSGEGEMIDPAKIAELISQQKLPKTVATVSSNAVAQAHGLKIIAENLQDADDNYTTFVLVKLVGDKFAVRTQLGSVTIA